ncbi:MAG: thiamine phosphate synthase [Dehalococcoidia bacterium]|nr:thiamine phosphate synthase [Dehalococcoidia bacterium]
MQRIVKPCLVLVTDRRLCPDGSFAARVEAAVQGGVDVVQLREKDLPAGELYRLALELKERIGGRALFVVNDRVDIALAVGADGVQLGEAGLPAAIARALLRYGMVIGRSVHSAEGAAQAEAEGADFLVLGTVFPSRSHPDEAAAGLRLVEKTRGKVSVPLLAIGGVTEQNAAMCLEAGADGVAVVSAILATPDSRIAAQRLKQVLHKAWGSQAAAAAK